MAYETEVGVAIDLARRAGAAAMQIYVSGDHGKETKDDGTFVGTADKLANGIIYEGIDRLFPTDGIVSEEMDTKQVTTPRSWYIDPIDGTNGFLHRSGEFAVHIGLVEDGKPVMGVVYQPVTQTLYHATEGDGAFKTTNITEQLYANEPAGQIVLATGHTTKPKAQEREDKIKQSIPYLIHRTGSEGLRWMHMIEGIADLRIGNINDRMGTWDGAAPHAILLEAGGYAIHTDGTELRYEGQRKIGKEFIASPSKDLAQRVLELLS